MPTPIINPAHSPTMEQRTLGMWNVQGRDKVSSGEVISKIESDQATMEVDATDEGFDVRTVPVTILADPAFRATFEK